MRKLLTLTAAAAFALAVGFGGTAQGKEGFPFDAGNLVGYWHFDKNSGTAVAVDGSVNTNDGSLLNGADRSIDVPDLPSNLNSVELEGGSNDHVSVGDPAALDLTGDLTLSAWINVDTAPASGVLAAIVTKWAQSATLDAYGIWVINDSGTLRLIAAIGVDGSADFGLTGGVISPSTWTHVAMTYDATSGANKIYVDGVEVGSRTRAGGTDTNDNDLLIGREDSGAPRPFDGLIDEVRVYSTALTGTQIATIFASLCDVTIAANTSIQTTINAAISGDHVCLVDDNGDFQDQEVVFESEHSGITLRAANGNEIPVLDGSGLSASGSHFAISFDSDDDALVEDVEIRGLTIQNYAGSGDGSDRSSAIQAFGTTPTESIRIRESTMTGFVWNGVLVGSEGDVIHKAWMVHSNTVSDVGFIGIELTNCTSCSILHNDVVTDSPSAGRSGILIQVRNTIPESGEVHINGVNVLHNTVDSAGATGIEVLVFAGNISTFQPIAGATSLLTTMVVNNNTLIDNGNHGIRYRTFNEAATLVGGNIKHNVIDCDTGDAPVVGIQVSESGFDGPGTISRVKLRRNRIDNDCVPKVETLSELFVP